MTRRKTAAATALTAQPEPANDAVSNEVASAASGPSNGTPAGGRVVGGTALPEPAGYDPDGNEDAFPDEEAESVESLRPVIPTPEDPEPGFRNTERVARQRQVFGDAPPRAARPPAHRRITAELVKAESALVRLERRRQDSADLHERTWRHKRLALIKSFPGDVLSALHAMNVLEDADIDELEGFAIEERGD
jgi:hypothetical protein